QRPGPPPGGPPDLPGAPAGPAHTRWEVLVPMERTRFLARIREGLAGVQGPALPETFPVTFGSGDHTDPFARFRAALIAVGGEASRVPIAGLDEVVRAVAGDARSAIVSDDLGEFAPSVERGLGAAGCSIEPVSREAAAQADLGVTSALAAVASTGSL